MSEYLQDPEYTPGASGCLQWLLEGYNGTKDKPNKRLLMRSPRISIGGYEWQIKFYPRGNATSYLSVYVECDDMLNKKKGSRLSGKEEKTCEESDRCTKSVEDINSLDRSKSDKVERDAKPPRQLIGTPIPYLHGVKLTKPTSVVALITMVLYNPEEPRVNHHRTIVHRFSRRSPDWGWKRFHGPHKAIHMRQRGQRQALLRGDKLAFKVYIRLICDPTGCLGQHKTDIYDLWNSLSMTGIRSLTLRGYDVTPSDSHFVCAISSWLMLKPFRQFLYNIDISNPYERPREKRRPFIVNLLKLLYFWRMPLKHKQRCISLGNTKNAIGWYGIDHSMEGCDVVDVWMVFRTVMEIEMNGSPPSPSSSFPFTSEHSPGMKRLGSLLGRKQSPVTGIPSYRIPIKGVQSIQEGIDKSENFLTHEDPLPELLSVELKRQAFNDTTREWKKVVDKVDIQENIRVRNVEYLLYGMIVHEGVLRSGIFYAVLRPHGPGGKWYKFSSDSKGGRVTCLTHKEAVTAHEGFSPAFDGKTDVKADEMSAIAYIAMYLRSDVATTAFETEDEPWDVPNWLEELIEEDKREEMDDGDDYSDDEVDDREDAEILPVNPSEAGEGREVDVAALNNKDVPEKSAKELEVQIIDSRMFLSHESYGNFDPSDPRLMKTATNNSSQYVHNIKLRSDATVDDINNILVDIIDDVKCKRQCRLWAMNSYWVLNKYALLMDPERSLKKNYLSERTERRFWVHVTPMRDLPSLPTASTNTAKDGEGEDGLQMVTQDEHESQVANVGDVNRRNQYSRDSAEQQPELRENSGHTDNDVGVTVINNLDESHASQPNQTDGLSLAEMTISNVDVDVSTVPLSTLSGDVGLSMDETIEPQNVPAARSEPVAIADSHNDDNDATPQVSANDGTNRQAISGQLREDYTNPLPSSTESNVQMTNVNQTEDEAVEDTSNKTSEVREDTYIFLKIFDQEAQKIIPWGSFITPVTSRVSTVIQKKLDLPDCENMSLWEEHARSTVSIFDRERTFAEEGLDKPGDIIIYCKTLSEERIAALANRAAFHEPESYLHYIGNLESFPEFINGPITVSNFGKGYYKVNCKHNNFHGHGYRIFLSGAEYTGEYRLNVFHGLGRMVYANGDEYNGYWADGLRHGQGRFVEAATGNTYVGEWRKDRQFGEGVTTWKVADVSERLCRICWDASADSAMYDCGHVVACLECAKRVENCPVCRRRVISAMKLFYVT